MVSLRLISRRFRFYLIDLTGNFLSFLLRKELEISILLKPKLRDSLNRQFSMENSDQNFVLVLQGPIINSIDLNYLLDTLTIYRKNFPRVKIIISSYFSCQIYLDLVNVDLYDEMILSDDKELNSNFEKQVFSSYNGILAGRKYNRKYVVKSRVDQRFTNPFSFSYFRMLLEKFPSNGPDYKPRIIGSSYNSWLYRPLGISDMLIVGTFEDLIKYWRFDSLVSEYKLNSCIENFDSTWLCEMNIHFETFLAARYLAESGFVFTKDAMDDNNRMWKDFMLIVNAQEIGHEWRKRNRLFVGNSLVKFDYHARADSLKEINFIDWISIYSEEFQVGKIDGYENI